MKNRIEYPIDIDELVAADQTRHPDNEYMVQAIRTFAPMVNEAYEQGRRDAEEAQG